MAKKSNKKAESIPIVRNRVNEVYRELVKIGLGVNKNMYALKHTGAAFYLMENATKENLYWLQNQMGHSTLETTSIYTNKFRFVLNKKERFIL